MLIEITNLTFAYENSAENLFENVSLRLDTDWRLGFIGRNGRGKTTFLRLLTGQLNSENAHIDGIIKAPANTIMFPQHINNPQNSTLQVLEELCNALEYQFKTEFAQLALDTSVLHRPFNTLSQGERTKALLAALFLSDHGFLLIDEPTNNLDAHGREIVQKYLASKKGFILVSHDRTFLDACIDHVLSLNKADIEVQKGNFSSWQLNRDRIDSSEAAQNEKLKKDIKRLDAATKRTATWSDKIEKTKVGTRNSGLRPDKGYIGHQAAKMMQRAKNTEKRRENALEEKASLLKNLERADGLELYPLQYHSSRLLALGGVCIEYGDRPVCQNISFTIERGERVRLAGGNGSGKSSLIKLILGQDIPHTGTVTVPPSLKISYVSQDTSHLFGDMSDFIAGEQLDESLFKTVLRKLDFERTAFETSLEELSSGQKKKILIAASLCTKAHLYIWDEPLNFIDVLSRMQIEELILQNCPTMLFVEHDSLFCQNIATKTIEL